MGRVYFPTRNENGVRDLSKSVTLGYYYDDRRGAAELPPKSSMTPVNLGIVFSPAARPCIPPPLAYGEIWVPNPTADNPCDGSIMGTAAPPPLQNRSPAPPVSSQTSPTPTVTVRAAPSPVAILVSSGGGTPSPAPATSTVVTAPPDLTDQVASWLGGTTPLGSWNVPNALLAAGVILGAAMLMGGGKRR